MVEENKAVFLDRDGVIIHDVNYLSNLDQIFFYEDVANGLSALKQAGFMLVIVTNQSGVARGYFDESFVKETHLEINQRLQHSNVKIDAFYYCPHHIDGKPPYNIKCQCRKPKTDMIIQAKNDLGIDLEKSFMLGDKSSDIELAVKAGIRGGLLKTGQGFNHVTKVKNKFPQIPIHETFSDAVASILAQHQ